MWQKRFTHHGVVYAGALHAGASLFLHEFECAGLPRPVVQVLAVPRPQPLAARHAALGPLRPARRGAADVTSEERERKNETGVCPSIVI